MAKYAGTYKDFPTVDYNAEDYSWQKADEIFREQEKKLEELDRISNNLPDGEVVGMVVSFGVADGSAIYIVTNDNPVTVRHIPFCDGYHAHKLIIKGIDKEWLLEEQARYKKYKSLFS